MFTNSTKSLICILLRQLMSEKNNQVDKYTLIKDIISDIPDGIQKQMVKHDADLAIDELVFDDKKLKYNDKGHLEFV